MGVADELQKLDELRRSGAINDDEYVLAKARVLAGSTAVTAVPRDEIPVAELEKAVRQSRAQFIYASDSVSSQGYVLGFLETIYTADAYGEVLDKLAAVTPEDVRRVVRTYFTEQNRTVGWYIPTEEETPA